jgi:hypothetical protein
VMLGLLGLGVALTSAGPLLAAMQGPRARPDTLSNE